MAEREELILEIRAELDKARSDVAVLEGQLAELEGRTTEVDIAVDDQASPVVESVTEEVATLDGATAETTLGADDQASPVVDAVAAEVAAFDGATAAVTLDADDSASDAIAEVAVGLEELDGSTAEATIEAEDDASDVAEDVLDALEKVEGTYTATIETEGAEEASENTTGIVANLTRIGGAAGAGGLAALSAAGFLAIGSNAADAALQVKGLADATGNGTDGALEQASRLNEVWTLAGGTTDTLERNIIRANDKLRESPELANALGLQIGENTSAMDVFIGAINALNSGQLSAADRLSLAMDVFGSRGVMMVNDLQTRIGDLDTAIDQISESEITTQEDIDAAIEIKEQMDAVGDVLGEIARDLMPSIAAGAETVATILNSWPVEKILAALEGGLDAINDLIGGEETFDPVAQGIEAVNELLGITGDQADNAGVSWANLQRELEAGRAESELAAVALEHLALLSGKSEEEILALAQGLDVAAAATEPLVSSISDINFALQDLEDQQARTAELWTVITEDLSDGRIESIAARDAWNELRDMLGLTEERMIALANQKVEEKLEAEADAALEAAEAQREHAEAIRETIAAFTDYLVEFDPAASRAAGFSAALESINEHYSELNQSQDVIGFVDSLRGIHEALHTASDEIGNFQDIDIIPDTWEEVLNFPEALRPVNDAIVNFREVMQTEFAEVFEEGGSTAAREWAVNTRTAIETELRASGELSEAQIQEIIAALGLLPDQVETTIRISEAEQARQILNDIAGLIEGIPPSVQREVALAIIAGDPELALALVQEYLDTHPTTVTTEADTTGATEGITEVTEADHPTTITAEADTARANDDLLDLITKPRTATINVEAPAARSVDATLDLVASDRTATVDVQTGNISVPSGAQLAARIGTIRVPIVAYWTSRIEGSRPR